MLNGSNIGLVRYKTVTMATLGSHSNIFFFTHQVSPPNTRSRSKYLSARLTVAGVVIRRW